MYEKWSNLKYKNIIKGFYKISTLGRIKLGNDEFIDKIYNSTNGFDYVQLFIDVDSEDRQNISKQYFPLDDLIANTFIPVPVSLENKRIKVCHIDGDTRNNSISNLNWTEDIETWRDVPGYEGFYEISSWARIRTVKTKRIRKTSLIKGYEYVCLYDHSTKKTRPCKVHRLYLMAFLPIENPELFFVNHIDEFSNHNWLKNLEWVTPSGNSSFGTLPERISTRNGKALRCLETGMIYVSTLDAERQTGISSKRIWECCCGKISVAGGYHWEWILKDKHSWNYGKPNTYTQKILGKKIMCVETGILYNSIREAARLVGLDRANLMRCLRDNNKTLKGFHWKIVDTSDGG